MDSVIHTEVHKIYPDAYTPTFTYTDPAPNRLIIRYHSKRRLYALMGGLINGVAEYYHLPVQQKITIHQVKDKEVGDFDLIFGEGDPQ